MIKSSTFKEIPDPLIRESLLYRIAQYVSPEPWGSPRAQLARANKAILRLFHHLLNSENLDDRSLCVGSKVWWRAVQVNEEDHRKVRAWMACRQPPASQSKTGMSEILDFRHSSNRIFEHLYDNRFLVRIYKDKMPSWIQSSDARLILFSDRPYYIPEIHLSGQGPRQILHTDIIWPYSWRREFRYSRPHIACDWIEIEYIRPMTL